MASMQVFLRESPIKKEIPLLLSALVILVIAGIIGISYLSTLTIHNPIINNSWLIKLYGAHWFFAIMGFTVGLISSEIMVLLSLEWSGRMASQYTILLFLALFWPAMILYPLGYTKLALILSVIYLLFLFIYASRVLLAPSLMGFKPTHYNYLLTATPLLLAALVTSWLVARVEGRTLFNLAMATTSFPVLTIIAIEGRDIPLLLGIKPTREFVLRKKKALSRRAVTAYVLAFLGILMASFEDTLGLLLGGITIILSALFSIFSTGLMEALSPQGLSSKTRRGLFYTVILAQIWLIIAGISLIVASLTNYHMAIDMAVHSITLGFMFNTIFGVDSVLLYGHAGIPLSMVPEPTFIPVILLNIALVLRAFYDLAGIAPLLAMLSGPLVGIAILWFYIRNFTKIRAILITIKKNVG